jgi:thiol-disulfide isomerase/thioredoxin
MKSLVLLIFTMTIFTLNPVQLVAQSLTAPSSQMRPPLDSTAVYVGPDGKALSGTVRDSLLALPGIQQLEKRGIGDQPKQIILFRSPDELKGFLPDNLIAQLKAEPSMSPMPGESATFPAGGMADMFGADAEFINGAGETLSEKARDSLLALPGTQMIKMISDSGKSQVVLFKSFDELSGILPPEALAQMKSGDGPTGGSGPPPAGAFAKKWVGQPALAMSGPDLVSEMLTADDLAGKIVVVNFWFVSCMPCLMEMPDLNEVVEKYKGQDVVFIAPTFDNQATIGKLFADGSRSFAYRIIPEYMELINQYGIKSFPTHMIIDRNGIIVEAFSGAMPGIGDVLAEMIDRALEQN